MSVDNVVPRLTGALENKAPDVQVRLLDALYVCHQNECKGSPSVNSYLILSSTHVTVGRRFRHSDGCHLPRGQRLSQRSSIEATISN